MLFRTLIDKKDFDAIEAALRADPALANEGIPYDHANSTKAHPLHRVCDWVFKGRYSEEEALHLANLLFQYGAHVNGNQLEENKDSPLVAAASLHADALAYLYIDRGAVIDHPGAHGGTALHWAAWCGRGKLVARLIREGASINKRCKDFMATPLFWAVHGLQQHGQQAPEAHMACIRQLLEAGADTDIPNGTGKTVFDLAATMEPAVMVLLTASRKQ